MNPERWQQVKQIFNQAISRGAPERAEFLRRACEGDEDLRREVESLVASHEQAETGFLKGAAIDFSAAAVAAAPPRERPIGPYEIVELIGRGGMGEVYRAFRADGQYSKEVAIKLVRSCVESGGLVERFRNERQILALLEHPNIARLLDGGTTHDGVPYLIMELAEGEPIDQFCESRGLSLSERLQLFRKVCDAVHYAHQRLVIHRDLKPSNIVVTAEGVPKLLDFGIAKLVDPAADGGMTMTRAMTLAYASPEQIRGEALTTATDVYSLGVVLYQMLTGRSPYPGDTSTPHGLARAICELYPIKPSVAASSTAARERPASDERSTSESSPRQRRRRLSGDLDNILLTALRKGPAERYGSVEQFGEDLRRYLDHVPIRARKDTAGYRLSKFIGRHRAGVAATILATLAILGGLGASVYEARSAGRQRARAEQRFRDMRQLARSNIFEFNDAIQNLPGSAAARNLVIQRALGFLEKLGSDEAGDPEVMHEVAAGYERVAALQGSFSGPGIGDTAAALASYKKALAIRESLVAASGGDAEDLNDEYVSLAGYVGTLTRSGRVGEALRTAQQELAVADLLAARQPGDHRSTLARAGALVDVAMAMGGNGSA
ncbi:MAG TPA: serine/threonine-protein kinase, partial [Terriglobales bacterium]|nr:serine/threonine-protein kinase [Terriglobales bacterium]